jgi:hypothetical protein
VAEKLRAKVGGQIAVINVIVPLTNYDEATQHRINALNVEKANTRVAEERAKTAAAEATTNEILAASVSNDPARESRISPLGGWPNHHGGANCAGPVTFGVFRFAWSDFCGTILVCCARCGPSAVRCWR